MTVAQGDRRRSAPAGPSNGVRELFKAEDVRLEWSSVRRTVGKPAACAVPCIPCLLSCSSHPPFHPDRQVFCLLLCPLVLQSLQGHVLERQEAHNCDLA